MVWYGMVLFLNHDFVTNRGEKYSSYIWDEDIFIKVDSPTGRNNSSRNMESGTLPNNKKGKYYIWSTKICLNHQKGKKKFLLLGESEVSAFSLTLISK